MIYIIDDFLRNKNLITRENGKTYYVIYGEVDSNQVVNGDLLDLYIEQNSALVLLILFSGFFWQAYLIFHKRLELEKKSHVMLLIMFFSLAIMVLINFFAIPIYGLTGAAFATACAALVYGFVNIVNGLIFFNKSTITHK